MINATGLGSQWHSVLCAKCVRNFSVCACPISDPGQKAYPPSCPPHPDEYHILFEVPCQFKYRVVPAVMEDHFAYSGNVLDVFHFEIDHFCIFAFLLRIRDEREICLHVITSSSDRDQKSPPRLQNRHAAAYFTFTPGRVNPLQDEGCNIDGIIEVICAKNPKRKRYCTSSCHIRLPHNIAVLFRNARSSIEPLQDLSAILMPVNGEGILAHWDEP